MSSFGGAQYLRLFQGWAPLREQIIMKIEAWKMLLSSSAPAMISIPRTHRELQ